MRRFVGPALILLCTVIWGSAFLAQKLGAAHLGPFAITCYRNILGGAFLALIALRKARPTRAELLGGAVSGVVLFAAMATQQIGIENTTPGVSAFLTANYVLLVPVFAWAVGRGRPRLGVWLSVALAIAGAFFISVVEADNITDGIGRGELWTLLCAALFAIQIMVVDRFARGVDVVRFSMVQLFAAALVALPFVFLPSEQARMSWARFAAGLPALLYVGVLSSGVAYTLQNLGQAKTPPVLAAIIMSMESVFGAFFGWLILGDIMTPQQIAGCAMVLGAVVLSQVWDVLMPWRDGRSSARRALPPESGS